MRPFRSLCLLFALCWASPALALPASGYGGVVATAHPDATEAGAAMLRQGGNAVDAAVAAAFTLAVSEPYSSGIGGGGFALVRIGESLRFLDFREVAPAQASREMFQRDGEAMPALSRDGALAVAVPGAVRGYLDLHERWGKLPRAAVLAPAIRAAEEGFLVDERYLRFTAMRLERLREDPEAARIFLVQEEAGGYQLPQLGARIVQPELAATLRAIAAEGGSAFYEGELAQRLVEDVQRRGGILSLEDLAAYRSKDREPLLGSYLGHAIATAPPPSAGGALILTTLNLLETLPADTPWRAPNALHLYIEALKRAFADRWLFGDPDFVQIPVEELISKERARKLAAEIGWEASPASEIEAGSGLAEAGAPNNSSVHAGNTDIPARDIRVQAVPARDTPEAGTSTGDIHPGGIQQIRDIPTRSGICPQKAPESSMGDQQTPCTGGLVAAQRSEAAVADNETEAAFGIHTTHLSVVDAAGNAVSLTTTINTPFGAAFVAKGTGVVLNNEMDDFAAAPGAPNAFGIVGAEANAVAAGKIPLSSMAPTLVFAGPKAEGPLRMVLGSPGGPRIPTTLIQILHSHLALGAPIDQALAFGRLHHQHLPDRVFYEPFSLDAATLGLLLVRGHRLQEGGLWGNATAITIDPQSGIRSGAADPRGVGSAIAVEAPGLGREEEREVKPDDAGLLP